MRMPDNNPTKLVFARDPIVQEYLGKVVGPGAIWQMWYASAGGELTPQTEWSVIEVTLTSLSMHYFRVSVYHAKWSLVEKAFSYYSQ